MSTQRVIRKLPKRPSRAFDDRPATVQWALGLWAVLVTALVLALGGFEETRLLHNGWFRLAGVAVTWGLLAWAASTPGKWMAQRLRLAAAASLAVHTLLALLLVFAHLTFLLTEPKPDVDRQVVVEPVETPKLVEVKQPSMDEQPVFEKPVPTDRLATQQQPEVEQAKAATSEPTEPRLEPPELATSKAPQSLAERRPRSALTHRAKSPSRRSRQPEVATLATTLPESIERPKQLASADRSQPSPTAELEKTAAAATPADTPDEPDIDSPPVPSPTRVVERTNSDAPRVAEVTPAPRRRQSPAEVVEPQLAEVAPAITTPETNRLAAEPTRLQRAKSPAPTRRDVPEPQQLSPVPPTAVARRDTRQVELPLAASPTPLDRRQPVSVAQAVELTPQTRQLADVTRTRSNIERPQEPVAPSTSKTQLASQTPREPVETDATEMSRAAPDAANPTRRSTPLAAEVANAIAERSLAEAAVSPSDAMPEPLVAAVPRETTRQASTSPAPRVLADSRGGTGSRGDGANTINDSPAAPTYSAPFAAAAAKRSRSTQTERGPALAPNPVAKTARSRAAADTPSSTLMALPIPNAQVAGSTTPQSTSASSSAAMEKQYANVTLGDVTAAQGESSFDTGPPQIAPERGRGRGKMGGRLAMRAPQTNSGLGPRRMSQAAMSPDATGIAQVPARAASPSGAQAVAANQSQTGGATVETATGRRGPARVAKLVQGRAPSGSVSGGGAAGPSVGPPPSATEVGSPPPRAGGSIARRRDPAGRGAGPAIAAAEPASPSRSTGSIASPMAVAAATVDPVAVALMTPLAVDLSQDGASPAPATASPANIAPKRRTLMPAELGAGGLGKEPSLDAGVPQRIARRQTTTLRMTPSRFANRSEGGEPTPPGRKRNPAPAYAARTDRNNASPITTPNDPSPKTEAAIELGLEFLAKLQQSDGRWSLGEFGDLPIGEEELPSIQADGAATGLALLAFLGGGYDHYDDKYQAVVQRGLDYLVSQQSAEGDIFPERDLPGPRATRFYSHGIATLALCEAYGMTGDPELRAPAQKALNYISRTQHRTLNGWRYTVGTNSDLSVTGWQMMALRSGELAGLQVNKQTYRRVAQFVEKCRASSGNEAMYCYNPYVSSTREGMKHYNKPGTVMTAVGMLMQLYLGENRDTPLMQRGADHLAQNLPTHTGEYRLVAVGTPRNPQRDTYYWYYATQVMFHMGGDHWQQWHEHLHPLLVDHQTQEGPLAGSWNPLKPMPDMWAGHAGRVYVTCLNLLSLEVSYRHLPLYEMTGK